MTANVRCCENQGFGERFGSQNIPEEKHNKNENGFFLEIGIQLFPFFKTVFLIFLWLVFYTVYERCDHTCLPGKRSVETVDGFADLQTCSLIAWSDSGINT